MLLISLKVHNEYSSPITPPAVLESLISFGLMHFPTDTGSRRHSIVAVMDNRAGSRWQRLELTSIEQREGSAGLDLALWLDPF